MEGWVTITREVAAFDESKADQLDSDENDILDSMADEACLNVTDFLDAEVDDTQVLRVEP